MGVPTQRTKNVFTEYLGPFSPARYRDIAEQRRSTAGGIPCTQVKPAAIT
jgi:hypothetical protein